MARFIIAWFRARLQDMGLQILILAGYILLSVMVWMFWDWTSICVTFWAVARRYWDDLMGDLGAGGG